MVKLNKMLGVALVLCLAMVSFGVIADDSDSSDAIAGPSLEQFSNNMNGYAKYLLGSSQTVISSSVSEDTLTATVNTASSNIDSISMNLYDCFDKFMDAVKSTDYLESVTIKNTATSAEYKIIVKDVNDNIVLNRGAMLDFALSVLQVIKDNKTSDTVTYNGSIIFNGHTESAKILKITINLDSTVRGLLETFFELKLIEIEVSQGKITSITINNNAYLADVLGKPTVSKFQGMTLIEIISCFAADGALAKLVSNSSQQSYLNKVCGKIVEANNLAGFIKNVFFVEVNSITMTFGEPTVSSSKNFKGLMETIKDAMSKGTNFDKKVSDISSYNDSTGVIAMKPITVKWNHGTETGTIVEDQKVDVVFGKATINTTVRSGQSTGTITIEPNANKYTCWEEVTIKCTAASNYTLSAVSYKVGDGEEIALTKVASQSFVIPSAGENTVINIFASFSGSSPTPPGPTPSEKFTVTIEATTGGSVSQSSVTVSKGTSYSASANVLRFGSAILGTEVTATPSEGYIFKSWSSTSGKVNSNMTITATFEKSGPVAPIEKVVENGSIYLPGDVVQALGITDASKLVLTIKSTKTVPSNVPEDAVCYQVTLTYDGKEIKTFNDYVTIGLKYTVPAGADVKNIKVYWVSDDGYTVEEMKATYDSDKGLMKFDIPHLSVFAITQKEIEPIHGKLVSISVKTAPSKLSYIEGEMFNPAGLVITLTYDHGNPSTLEYKGNESQFGFTPSLTTPLKTSDKAVAITYDGKTTTQAITVSAEPEPTPSGGDNTVLYIVIAIIVIIVVIAIVFFFLKKKGI